MIRVFHSSGTYVDYGCELRWRFDWLNRPTKYGAWTDPGAPNDVGTKAWMQPKEHIVRAAIEAKHRRTRKISILAECDGHEFIEFRWISAAPIPTGGTFKIYGAIQGMTLVTPSEKIHAYINGNVIREPNTERKVLSHAWQI